MNAKHTYRPQLEGLEDRIALSVAGAGFRAEGVWRWTDSVGWVQLTPSAPLSVAVNDFGSVAASFNNAGVWRDENGSGWRLLSTTPTTLVGIDDSNRVVADLGQYGIWRFSDSGAWRC